MSFLMKTSYQPLHIPNPEFLVVFNTNLHHTQHQQLMIMSLTLTIPQQFASNEDAPGIAPDNYTTTFLLATSHPSLSRDPALSSEEEEPHEFSETMLDSKDSDSFPDHMPRQLRQSTRLQSIQHLNVANHKELDDIPYMRHAFHLEITPSLSSQDPNDFLPPPVD